MSRREVCFCKKLNFMLFSPFFCGITARNPTSLDMSISLVSCKIEYRNLGQELVTRVMNRMKVVGTGRLCFQFLAQPQNVVTGSPLTRIVLEYQHFIK